MVRGGKALFLVAAATVSTILLSNPPGARSQGSEGIVAIVNDDIVSAFDVDARMKLALVSASLPDQPEVRKRIAAQVVRNLIDDSLRLQEASKHQINVVPKEIDQAFERLEQGNKLPKGGLDDFLKKNNIDKLTLVKQVKAQIAWTKLVRQRIAPRVSVGDDEINEALEQIAANQGKPEHLVSEIFLPIDPQSPETEVKELAERLFEQLRRGANFGALAQTFSQSASAASGGDLGWMREDQLGNELGPVVAKMEPGQLSYPVRAIDGYHLVLLRDRRIGTGFVNQAVSVSLQQIFLPIEQNARQTDIANQMARAKEVSAKARSCEDMARLSAEIGSPASGRLNNIKVSDLPPKVQTVVQTTEIGQASAPIRSAAGIIVIMVCDRHGTLNEEEARRRVRNSLMFQKVELEARKYLRNLRRSAFTEIRR